MDETLLDLPGLNVTAASPANEEAPLTKDARLSIAAETLGQLDESNFKKPDLKRVKATIEAGENQFRQKGRVETKAFDAAFLVALEEGLEAVGRILANPRTFIKETTELENVEKAKKVSSISIQHFASHSQYLRTIKDNGEVIPDKILTIHSETNTAIYENRFVMTLIKRCLSFIEQRYTFIHEHGETRDSDELTLRSNVDFSGVTYEVALRVKASIPSSDAGNSEKNDDILRRLSVCKSKVGDYMRSNFMAQMKGAKDVASPVHMTNMLLKHPDYHKAYELWEFIEAYDTLGVSYDVTETDTSFDEDYLEDLYELLAEAILKLRSRHLEKARSLEESRSRRITPKVIFSLDDLHYEDGRFFFDAFPAALELPSEDPIFEEERKKILEQRLGHLAAEQANAQKASKGIAKHKDRVEFDGALSRDKKKSVLREEESARRSIREKEEATKRAAEAKKAEEERKKRAAEEEKRYAEAHKKLIGDGNA